MGKFRAQRHTEQKFAGNQHKEVGAGVASSKLKPLDKRGTSIKEDFLMNKVKVAYSDLC